MSVSVMPWQSLVLRGGAARDYMQDMAAEAINIYALGTTPDSPTPALGSLQLDLVTYVDGSFDVFFNPNLQVQFTSAGAPQLYPQAEEVWQPALTELSRGLGIAGARVGAGEDILTVYAKFRAGSADRVAMLVLWWLDDALPKVTARLLTSPYESNQQLGLFYLQFFTPAQKVLVDQLMESGQ